MVGAVNGCCGVRSKFPREEVFPSMVQVNTEKERPGEVWRLRLVSVSAKGRNDIPDTYFTKLLEGDEMKFLEVTWAVGNQKKKVWYEEPQGGLFTTRKAGKRRKRKKRRYPFQKMSWNKDVRTIFFLPFWPTWLSFCWLRLVGIEEYLLKNTLVFLLKNTY